MAPPSSPARRAWVPLLLALAAVGLGLSYLRRPGDFAGYLLIGELALEGRHLYRDSPPGVSTWPPLFSFLCVPLALLARVNLHLARAVWLALNAAALVLVLRLVGRLVWDRPMRAADLAGATLLVPLLLTLRYVLSNFEHLQVNILIYALALGGLALLARGRELPGGLALGGAAALKVMPVLFVPYLAWRRRYRAAALTAAAALLFSLLPAAVYGPARFADYLGAWLGAVRTGWSVGKMNLSVYAMWDRVLGHGLVPFAAPGFNELPPSGNPRVAVALAVSLALVAITAWWAFRRPAADARRALLAEWSVVFLVASLFGTVAWKAYLIVLLLPTALLWERFRSADAPADVRRGSALVLAVGFALGGLTSDDLIGRSLAWRLEMGSIVTVAALVQLAGLLWLRWRLGRHVG